MVEVVGAHMSIEVSTKVGPCEQNKNSNEISMYSASSVKIFGSLSLYSACLRTFV